MTKSPRKNVPGVGIELGATYMPSGYVSDRATATGPMDWWKNIMPALKSFCNKVYRNQNSMGTKFTDFQKLCGNLFFFGTIQKVYQPQDIK